MQELDKSTATLKQAIDDIIDYFNSGAEISEELRTALVLYSAKLEFFTNCLYNINYND